MKTIRHIVLGSILFVSTSTALGAPINVRLSPNATAPLIGTLDSPKLAVAAEWPEGIESVSGWRPIYFQSEFTVFVVNGDIGKNLLPKIGVPYLLSPAPDAPQLALAAADDDAELMSVDPRYARIRLSSVVLSYIQDIPAPAPVINANPGAQPSVSANSNTSATLLGINAAPADANIKTLSGILVKANAIERSRFGLQYKLINDANQNLAFVNTAGLAKFVLVTDYVNTRIQVTGPIESAEKGDKLIITAQSLKKAI